MRKEFEMTPDELKELLEACRPVPAIMLQCGNPTSQQEHANIAWRSLAAKRGFDWETVQPVPGKGMAFFTADASQ